MVDDMYSNIINGMRLIDIDDKHLMVRGGRGGAALGQMDSLSLC